MTDLIMMGKKAKKRLFVLSQMSENVKNQSLMAIANQLEKTNRCYSCCESKRCKCKAAGFI